VDSTATQPPRRSETALTGDAWIRKPRQPPRESETPVTGDAWIRKPRQPPRESETPVTEFPDAVFLGVDVESPLGQVEVASLEISLRVSEGHNF